MPNGLGSFTPALGGALERRGVSRGAMGINQEILGRAREAGFFDPFGSPRLRALRRRRALQLADIQRGRAGTYGRLIGLDPMSQRAALSRADISANAGMAGGLLGADVEEQQRNLDFFRQLYGGELDFQRQRQLEREAAKREASGGIGTAVGGFAGKIGGRLIDKWIPI